MPNSNQNSSSKSSAQTSFTQNEIRGLPQHIAIVMDGNRRWARQNRLKIFAGHEKVAKNGIEKLVDHCLKLGIPYLTLWAFSTENWKRDEREVEAILTLMREMFDEKQKLLEEKQVRVNTIGDISRFPKDIQRKIQFWQDRTRNRDKMVVTFALNYGGRDEILRAIGKLASEQLSTELEKKNGVKKMAAYLQNLTEDQFERYLDTADLPDPDLIIRPGGEKRLSGYLSWQSTYAELYFTDVLMPDFDDKELARALEEFEQRQRRFGG